MPPFTRMFAEPTGSPDPPMIHLVRNLLVALVLCTAVAAVAQPGAPTIKEIEVVGAMTVSPRQVLAWSGFETDRPLTADLAAQGIRNLFATKKFADIFLYRQDVDGGVKLIINLQEFPRIRSITFTGNRKVKQNDLREAFPVQVGQFANPAVIRRDLQPLRELYFEKGYYNVDVNTDSTVVDVITSARFFFAKPAGVKWIRESKDSIFPSMT